MRLSDGEIHVESESAAHVLPRAKFSYQYSVPVRTGIFAYGYAPEEIKADVKADPEDPADRNVVEGAGPEQKLSYGNGDITFAGLNKYNAPPESRAIVARMHIHFGHPRKEDLLRFCASQGDSATTLAVVSAL